MFINYTRCKCKNFNIVMAYMRVTLILAVVKCRLVMSDLFLSNDVSNWTDALHSDECNLTGKSRTAERFDATEFVLLPGNPTNVSHAWIGAYLKQSKWINFDGCRLMEITTDSPVTFSTFDDVYITCVNKCGSNKILLHKNYCYCQNHVVRPVDIHCNSSACGVEYFGYCGTEEHVSNANKVKHHCLCQYDVIADVNEEVTIREPSKLDNQGECLSVKVSGDSGPVYYTTDCNSYTDGMVCKDFESSHLFAIRGTWREAFGNCESQNKSHQLDGVRGQIMIPKNVQAGSYWIGMRRFSKLMWGATDTDISSNTGSYTYQCTGLLISNPAFVHMNCSMEYLSLCDVTESSLSVSTDTIVTSVHVTASSSPVGGTASPHSHPGTQSSTVTSLVIAVIVVCLLVLLIAIVLFILRWKGKWHNNPLEMCRSSKSILKEDTDTHIEMTSNNITARNKYDTVNKGQHNVNTYNHGNEHDLTTYSHLQTNPTSGAPVLGSEYDSMAAIQSQQLGIYNTTQAPSSGDSPALDASYDSMSNVPRTSL